MVIREGNMEMGNTHTHLGTGLTFYCDGVVTLSSRPDISFL